MWTRSFCPRSLQPIGSTTLFADAHICVSALQSMWVISSISLNEYLHLPVPWASYRLTHPRQHMHLSFVYFCLSTNHNHTNKDVRKWLFLWRSHTYQLDCACLVDPIHHEWMNECLIHVCGCDCTSDSTNWAIIFTSAAGKSSTIICRLDHDPSCCEHHLDSIRLVILSSSTLLVCWYDSYNRVLCLPSSWCRFIW